MTTPGGGTTPLVSVVIPSLNQREFIEQSIVSVLGQGVPGIEVLVVDGGSTDGSVDVIRKYEGQLAYWVSEPDRGQASAINKGFRRARGRILAWLNSDDFYLPGALRRVVERVSSLGDRALVYGGCLQFIEGGGEAWARPTQPFDASRLRHHDFVVQPAAFWTRALWDGAGELDETMTYAFDWDWFIRAAQLCAFTPVPEYLACYRIHRGHKTGTGGAARFAEVVGVVSRHDSPEWERAFRAVLQGGERARRKVELLRRTRLFRFRRLAFPLLYLRHGGARIDTVFDML